jgi:hypothetical protein
MLAGSGGRARSPRRSPPAAETGQARRNALNLETTRNAAKGEVGLSKLETEFRNDAFPAAVLHSESFYQLANIIVIAGGNENHPTAPYAKR